MKKKISFDDAIELAKNYWYKKDNKFDEKSICVFGSELNHDPYKSGTRVVARAEIELMGIDGGDMLCIDIDEDGNIYEVPTW